jgi:FtsZ-binding cell division protein ZapB
MKTAIGILQNEINEIKDNINYLKDKNKEHQETIDGNNIIIINLKLLICDLEDCCDLLHNKKKS